MKVVTYTTSYLAVFLLLLITVWAGIFYYAMLDEIYDSIDDGLDNQKGLILQKVKKDSTILFKTDFDEGDYSITGIEAEAAKEFFDEYLDTSMYMQNEQDYEPVRMLRTVFSHNNRYYQMQVITSMVEEDDLFSELLYAIIFLYVGLIATILLLNNFLLKRIWRPFYHLLKQLRHFRLEQPSIETRKTNIEEFRLLNEVVAKMIQSNVDSYNSQKHFIENASHELQTPLAISINKLEALAATGKFSEQESQLLASALDNLERLTRLNKSLLLLSKIENKQFVSTVPVNINALVKKIIDDFSDQLAYREISISVKEKHQAVVQMNEDLSLIFFNNLVKNAMVHNYSGGTIAITIGRESFEIANTGKDQPLDESMLFTRFHKEKQSATSTGLGLSIVKAIAGLFGFKVSYHYEGRHVIRVQFSS